MSELFFIENYKDLCNLIQQHIKIIEVNNAEILYYRKQIYATGPKDISAISYSGQPSGNLSPISLDRCVEGIRRCEHLNEIEEDILQKLMDKKADIEKKIDEMEGLYFKVAIKRDIEGKKLSAIAAELGLSEDYIRHISAEIK